MGPRGLLPLDPSARGARYTWGVNKVLAFTSHVFSTFKFFVFFLLFFLFGFLTLTFGSFWQHLATFANFYQILLLLILANFWQVLSCHHVILLYFHPAILQSSHFVILSSYHPVLLSSCQSDLSICQLVNLIALGFSAFQIAIKAIFNAEELFCVQNQQEF